MCLRYFRSVVKPCFPSNSSEPMTLPILSNCTHTLNKLLTRKNMYQSTNKKYKTSLTSTSFVRHSIPILDSHYFFTLETEQKLAIDFDVKHSILGWFYYSNIYRETLYVIIYNITRSRWKCLYHSVEIITEDLVETALELFWIFFISSLSTSQYFSVFHARAAGYNRNRERMRRT